MSGKSVAVSVRLSNEEAAFLAAFEASGATTLSDKLRSMITEARRRGELGKNYADSLRYVDALLAPTLHGIREAEAELGLHSALLLQLAHWLPDAIAFLIAGAPTDGEGMAETDLRRLEAGAADRVFDMMENTLRLGVTGTSPCYDADTIARRYESVAKLIDLIKHSNVERTGDKAHG
mgnify:CR=1 FL=1